MPQVASYWAKVAIKGCGHIAMFNDKVLKTLVNHDASV
jgi:hypothetical protein